MELAGIRHARVGADGIYAAERLRRRGTALLRAPRRARMRGGGGAWDTGRERAYPFVSLPLCRSPYISLSRTPSSLSSSSLLSPSLCSLSNKTEGRAAVPDRVPAQLFWLEPPGAPWQRRVL